jgi:type I protein arginine methyltransferase
MTMSNPDYPVAGYGDMMADQVRMAAYEAALGAACRPDCVVLDLGTGTGILALLACRLGARRVYAIEPSDAVSVAREIAQANGVADRITFVQGLSTDISLPEPVDVIVADVRGVLPMTGTSLATMMDARRFLEAGGILIPARDTIRGALADHQRAYDALVAPWRRHAFGFDASAAERLVLQTWRKTHAPAEELLTDSCDLFDLDYGSLSTTNVGGSFTTEVVRHGTAHGLCVWFDTQLFGPIGFSNAPGRPQAIYGQGFFPLPVPVAVDAGDVVAVDLRAIQAYDDYIWIWGTTVTSAHGLVKARSSQSTFHAAPMSAQGLWKLDQQARPTLGADGAIDRFVLNHLDGCTTLSSLAGSLSAEFPDRFRDRRSAMARVTAVTSRYDCVRPEPSVES